MFCIKCGHELEDNAAFCSRCGYPVPKEEPPGRDDVPGSETEPDKQPGEKEQPEEGKEEKKKEEQDKQPEQKEADGQETPPGTGGEEKGENAAANTRKIKPFFIGLPIVAALLIVILLMDSRNSYTFQRDDNYYAPVEYPDNIGIYTGQDEQNMNRTIVTDENKLIQGIYTASVAENGTIAYQTEEEGEVHICGNGLEDLIPAPVYDFKISGAGNKVVYRTDADDNEETYVRDIEKGKSKPISGVSLMDLDGISYAGNGICTSSGWETSDGYYYHNAGYIENEKMIHDIEDGSVMGMSSDGKYVYYTQRTSEGSSGEFPKDQIDIMVRRNRENQVLITDTPPEEDPYIIAQSGDYQEILFTCGSDIYYYSAESDLKEAQYVDTIENAKLSPVDAYNRDRQQKSIIGNIYTILEILDEESGTFAESIVRLDENLKLTTLISCDGYMKAVRRSQDGTKLWCVAEYEETDEYGDFMRENYLAYCDLSKGNGAEIYDDINIYVNEEDNNWDAAAVSRDGSKAYVIDEENTLWEFTAEAFDKPVAIEQNISSVHYASDDNLYVIKNDAVHDDIYDDEYDFSYDDVYDDAYDAAYDDMYDDVYDDTYDDIYDDSEDEPKGIFQDNNLYVMSEDGSMRLIHENVAGMHSTKKNQYFFAEESPGSNSYTLYYKNGDKWSVLCDGSGGDEMDLGVMFDKIYWGEPDEE